MMSSDVVFRFVVFLFLTFCLAACGGSGETDSDAMTRVGTLISAGDATSFAQPPQVAIDDSGNTIVLWNQKDGVNWGIQSNRYVVDEGWGTAALIDVSHAGDISSDPRVSVDGNGNAMVVWDQSDGTRDNIWANRYVADVGWGASELVETDNAGRAIFPQVSIDMNGNAMAVWQHSDGSRFNVKANRYILGLGWGTSELIETVDLGNVWNQQVIVDASGNAVAVWRQYDGTRDNIWANRFVVGVGWGAAELIENENGGSASVPQIVMDASGNAVVVWRQNDGAGSTNFWANSYLVGSGWGTASLIGSGSPISPSNHQMAMDSNGNVIVVWEQFDGSSRNIWYNRYVVGSGWSVAEAIETDDSVNAGDPQVAVDASGNAVAVWEQNDGSLYTVRAHYFVPGFGFSLAKTIEIDSNATTSMPQVVVDDSGNALMVWWERQRSGSSSNIWAYRWQVQ